MTLSQEVLTFIESKSPLHSKKLKKNFLLHPTMLSDLEVFLKTYAPYLQRLSINGADLAQSYMKMVEQMTCSRLSFMKTGVYPANSHEQAINDVYAEPKIMTQYMLGLALSQFLWKHHYDLFTFYRKILVNKPEIKTALEVGSGHGLFLFELLSELKSLQHVDVVDISQTSLDLTAGLLKTLMPSGAKRVTFHHSDIKLFNEMSSYDFITMGEVLEHVPDPQSILEKIRTLLAPGGVLYMTTCVNCPTIDHIYHFKTIEEVRELLNVSGFSIIDEVISPSEEIPQEKLDEYKVDISYGALLKSRDDV